MPENTDNEFPGFEFRHYPAGPERDTARAFYQMLLDLKWLREGKAKELFKNRLLEAREAAMIAASLMVK